MTNRRLALALILALAMQGRSSAQGVSASDTSVWIADHLPRNTTSIGPDTFMSTSADYAAKGCSIYVNTTFTSAVTQNPNADETAVYELKGEAIPGKRFAAVAGKGNIAFRLVDPSSLEVQQRRAFLSMQMVGPNIFTFVFLDEDDADRMLRAEICGLKWADFDPVTGHIMVKRAAKVVDGHVVIGNLKTRSSLRTEVVDDHMVEILKRQRLSQLEQRLSLGLGNPGPDGFIFERPDGLPWNPNEMSRKFSRLVRRHRLPAMRFHDLRHANASLRHASGSSLKDICAGLGHSNIGITANLYVHLFEGAKREQSERLSVYLGTVLPAIRRESRV